MVDEFQDASHARARLTRGLVNKRGKYLLAVGDDWQSINRFAGADLSVMTRFTDWFGTGPTLRLETTFRCPQTICDAASTFVGKNPRQLKKQVRSAHSDPGPRLSLIRTGRSDDVPAALERHLEALAAQVANGEAPSSRNGLPTVHVLGRYGFDRDVMPRRTLPALDVHFRTAHSSKGLEADYIVIPRMVSGTYGFPSEIVDDPVMDLVMATPDDYPHAEERRLFYVALTRARRSVTLITVQGQESPFITELIKDNLLDLAPTSQSLSDLRVCALCGEGLMVPRSGPYGAFLGCNRFPKCRNKERVPS